MRLRYPGMREVDGLLWSARDVRREAARFAAAIGGQVLLTTEPGPGPTFADFRAAHRVVCRDASRDIVWVAPRWIAWLYRWLPVWIHWHNAPHERLAQPAPYFLFTVVAGRWYVGWLPARRAPRYRARLGLLYCKDRRVVL